MKSMGWCVEEKVIQHKKIRGDRAILKDCLLELLKDKDWLDSENDKGVTLKFRDNYIYYVKGNHDKKECFALCGPNGWLQNHKADDVLVVFSFFSNYNSDWLKLVAEDIDSIKAQTKPDENLINSFVDNIVEKLKESLDIKEEEIKKDDILTIYVGTEGEFQDFYKKETESYEETTDLATVIRLLDKKKKTYIEKGKLNIKENDYIILIDTFVDMNGF